MACFGPSLNSYGRYSDSPRLRWPLAPNPLLLASFILLLFILLLFCFLQLHAGSINKMNDVNSAPEQPDCEAFMLTAKRNEVQKCVEVLPNKWQKFIDHESNWPYFYNVETQEVSEHPSTHIQILPLLN